MEWNQGYTSNYTCNIVDPESWRDIDTIDITEGQISRDDSELIESATITSNANPGEVYIRIYMNTEQRGATERVALFTGLTSIPKRDIKGSRERYPVECYSVLKPAQDILMQRGWYAPAGLTGTAIIKQLLAPCPCPVELAENAPTLTESIIAEDEETNLSMVHKIADAMGWRIKITGDGTVRIEPKPTAAAETFDALDNDIIEPEVSEEYNWFECPNILRAVMNDTVAIARDDDPDSVLSTISRGREIWAQETSVELADGELLGAYAKRKLKELQSKARNINYNRRFYPDIVVGDFIRINYPQQGLTGIFKIQSQTVDIGTVCKVTETVVEEWQTNQ